MLNYFLGRGERWQTRTYVKYIVCNTVTGVMEESENGKRERKIERVCVCLSGAKLQF